jgi:glycosyltransferase involved in cell wall biosynthesis
MHVSILGTRGIPAAHGGFETFAEDLSLYLLSKGHSVTVYCQTESESERPVEDIWNGVQRVNIPAPDGPLGTISFDWAATRHSSRQAGVVLTLGYNTAALSALYRLRHVPSVMNMDGIEWKRDKWAFFPRQWLRFNEWAGARLANHLVADHPEISRHLQSHTPAEKITVIPYGADVISSAPVEPIARYGLASKGYYLLIARPEPENSILEVVRAFSSPGVSAELVVLGNYSGAELGPGYQRDVRNAAKENVRFMGAIYDRDFVQALRFHARGYVHGHRVGGTNPSLVESLAAGNAVIAHDNRFTRWVAGPGARFFEGADDLAETIRALETDPAQLLNMEAASRQRHGEAFTQEKVLGAYEGLLMEIARQHNR